jgi:hypothetical protein
VNNNYNSNTVIKQDFAVVKQVDGQAAHMTDTTRHQIISPPPLPEHAESIPVRNWINFIQDPFSLNLKSPVLYFLHKKCCRVNWRGWHIDSYRSDMLYINSFSIYKYCKVINISKWAILLATKLPALNKFHLDFSWSCTNFSPSAYRNFFSSLTPCMNFFLDLPPPSQDI